MVGGSTGLRWAGGLARRKEEEEEEEGGRRTPGPGHQTREHTVNPLLLLSFVDELFHMRRRQVGNLEEEISPNRLQSSFWRSYFFKQTYWLRKRGAELKNGSKFVVALY